MNIAVIRFDSNELHTAAEVFEQFGPPVDREGLRNFLTSARNFLLAASLDGAWAGIGIGFQLGRPDGGSMLFLYSLDVLPQYRRRGVATALLTFVRELAEKEGMEELFVFTTRSNRAAVEFYKATGGIIENGDDLLFVYPTRGRKTARSKKSRHHG